ncbi:DUF5682 family protein [Streptomyces sp. K1PA1]|uniref:DUF5682 family protein n=1 Tax=Streptomyces tropicalis TaxID=3034234 RepID=A0ABT6A8U1_9ACTN|nr:DUF5682 family protein [Streptomyces tropicalis]
MLLGIRHHGPGSARAVRAALEAARPSAVLIEGPPEADALVPLAADAGMRPPVALLAHAVDEPGRSVFWPLAAFSPEWVALRWALEHEVPVRFIDLPAAHTLAGPPEDTGGPPAAPDGIRAEPPGGTHPGPDGAGAIGAGPGGAGPDGGGAAGDPPTRPGPGAEQAEPQDGGAAEAAGAAQAEAVDTTGTTAAEAGERAAADPVRVDPLAALARAAGYDDPERWWEDAVEHRGADSGDPFAPFAALEEAMEALRETCGAGGDPRDLVREAHMRLRVRAARREFGDGVAVVCGAWHVPALRRRTAVAADRALLKGLPRARTDMTWVPWTHRRLSRSSGYGAGIDSPGWYAHLFDAPDRPVERWLTRVAGLLREEDRIVSSAHVIEAVRLAGTLAALRGRPLPGLGETTEAVRAVMCDGSDVPLALVRDRLVVGDVLGEVPDTAPAVPLQRDLTRLQRRLRLRPEAREREVELDLRKETDAGRSRLLHRLRLLGVAWGEPAVSRGTTGTFRESWRLRWEPELSVRVAEAGGWGTTVPAAAAAKAEADAVAAGSLAAVTALAEQCLLAGLADALPVVMRVLSDRAALDADVGHLAQALPALVRALRYGDVRGTATRALTEVAAGLAERVFVGLPPACAGLDADAAQEMRRHVDAVHTAVGLLGDTPAAAPGGPGPGDVRVRWHTVLRTLADRDTVPGVVRGRAARLLLDDGGTEQEWAARVMGLVLSPGTPPTDAAAWIEGFVGDGGMLLLHDERLLGLVDAWLTGVPAEAFTDVLPLLRRTFAAYEPGVRRSLGELVRRGPAGGAGSGTAPSAGPPGFGAGLDEGRADAVLPVLGLLLGLDAPGAADPDLPAQGTRGVHGTHAGHGVGEDRTAAATAGSAPSARAGTETGRRRAAGDGGGVRMNAVEGAVR